MNIKDKCLFMRNSNSLFIRSGFYMAVAALTVMPSVQMAAANPVDGIEVINQSKITVKGVVFDEEGYPVPGANIIVKGSTVGTITDIEGNFSIIAEAGQSLSVSFVGYEKQEVLIVAGKTNYTIHLNTESEVLSEVVVTGYQTISKERAAGSFSILRQDDMQDKMQTNILDRMEGMVAGMKTNPNGSLEIRGISTLVGNTKPLYVVDGIPYEGDIQAINPSEIVNITVLKDASAASIYGARSANGVIVITTRNGEVGKPKVRYNGTIKFEPLPDRGYMNLTSSKELVDLQKELFGYFHNTWDESSPNFMNEVYDLMYRNEAGLINDAELEKQLDVYRYRERYHQILDEFVRRSNTTHQHNLSISGGSDIYKYALSANYQQQLPHEKEKKMDKYGFSLKNQFDFFKWLTVDVNILNSTNGSDYDNGFSGYGMLYSGSSYRMLREADGSPTQWYSTGKNQAEIDRLNSLGLRDETYYPVTSMNTAHKYEKNSYWNINVGAKFKIAKGLSFDIRYQTEKTNGYNKQYYTKNYYKVNQMINDATVIDKKTGKVTHYVPEGGQMKETWARDNSYTLRAQLNFNREFSSKHAVQMIAGAERRKVVNQFTMLHKYGYDDNSLSWKAIDELTLSSNIRGTESVFGSFSFANSKLGDDTFSYVDNRYVSFYGNASYTYNHRLNFTGSIRIDQSNLFGTDSKYQYKPLWSLGAKYVVLENLGFLDRLSARMTYGINGNVAKNVGPYMIVRDDGSNYYTNEYQAVISSAPNNSLRWEKTKLFNIGVDFNMFKNRLNGSIEFYNKATDDLLGDRLTDATSGWPKLMQNYGSMVNRGVELTLQGMVLSTKDFSWDASFMFSYNKNKLTKLDAAGTSANYWYSRDREKVGYPLGSIFAIRYAGLDEEGNPIAYKADGTIINSSRDLEAEDLKYVGTRHAPYSASLSNHFKYKNFDLSFMFVYYGGNVMRDVASSYMFTMYPVLNYTSAMDRDRLNFWREPGDEKDPDMNPAFQFRNGKTCADLWRYADKHIEKGDYIKLRDITVGYTFPKEWLRKAYIQSLRFSLQIQNSFYWAANKKHLDPEVATDSSRGQHLPATYTLGLAIDF